MSVKHLEPPKSEQIWIVESFWPPVAAACLLRLSRNISVHGCRVPFVRRIIARSASFFRKQAQDPYRRVQCGRLQKTLHRCHARQSQRARPRGHGDRHRRLSRLLAMPVDELLADPAKAKAWLKKFEDRGIRVATLSCHGNPCIRIPNTPPRTWRRSRRPCCWPSALESRSSSASPGVRVVRPRILSRTGSRTVGLRIRRHAEVAVE